MSKNHSVAIALRLWHKSRDFKNIENPRCYGFVITALKKYILPSKKPEYENINLTNVQFEDVCEDWSVEELKNAIDVFDASFDREISLGNVSKSTKRNYRTYLNSFLNWIYRQTWWNFYFQVDSIPERVPFKSRGVAQPPKKKKKREDINYGCKPEELSKRARAEINELYSFWVKGIVPPVPALNDGNYNKRRYEVEHTIGEDNWRKNGMRFIYLYAGFLNKKENISPQDFQLDRLLDIDLIYKFNNFQVKERGNTSSPAKKAVDVAIAVAKRKYFYISKREDYSDIEVIYQLREARRVMERKYKKQHKANVTQKWEEKKISHEEARIIVDELYKQIAPKDNSGSRRAKSVIALAWQRYLFVKCLVYLPVRQKELRELVLNKNIFRVKDKKKDFYKVKTKRKDFHQTGAYESYKIPRNLTKDFDIWLFKIQPLIMQAVESVEEWEDFIGLNIKNIQAGKQRLEILEKVKNENWSSLKKILPPHITTQKKFDTYKYNLAKRISKESTRILALGATRENVAKYLKEQQQVFLTLSFNNREAFASPICEKGVINMVKTATGMGTKARPDIFPQKIELTPHLFRHIGEYHVRDKNPAIKAKFAKLLNHSERMGDMYADQLTNTFDETFDISDDWWEET